MDAHQIRGLALVSLSNAERVGRVTDVVFQTSPLRAAALRIATGGADVLIDFDQVRSVGSDAITTDSSERVRPDTRGGNDGLMGIDAMTSLKVVDEDGSYVGQVDRVELDTATGAVQGVQVRRGEVLGIGGERRSIPAGEILAVGREVLTVSARTATADAD